LPPHPLLIKKTSKGINLPWRLSYWHLLVIPFHNLLKIETSKKGHEERIPSRNKKTDEYLKLYLEQNFCRRILHHGKNFEGLFHHPNLLKGKSLLATVGFTILLNNFFVKTKKSL